MGSNSAIEWTKHTWNPWVGCLKVSPGCKHCYMYREQNRYGNDPREIRRTKPATFDKPHKWNDKDPGLVFTCSWSDFFLEEADQWRDQAWRVIKDTPNNTYQILTKRIENVAPRLPGDWGDGYENVWLGVSCENQEMANLRIPLLLNIPAKMKFLSLEPLLGPINLYEARAMEMAGPNWAGLNPLVDWVIVGGESGLPAYARPMHPGWAIEILAQCQEANIPFFFKQWGQWIESVKARPDGWTRLLWPDGFFGPVDWDVEDLKGDVYQMMPTFNTKYPPLLAGKEWKQFPPVHVGWDPAEQSGFGPLFKGLYND